MTLWEIRDRKQYLEKQEAREYLHMMRIVNAGFNGGEGAIAMQRELQEKAFPPMLTMFDKYRKPRNWIRQMIDRSMSDE